MAYGFDMKFKSFMEQSHLMALHHKHQTWVLPLTQTLQSQGFSLHDSLVLLALFFEPGKDTSPSQLVETLKIPKDQVSHSLRRLEEADWIIRTLHPTDSRRRRLSITALGKKKAADLIRIFDHKEQDYEEALKVNKF